MPIRFDYNEDYYKNPFIQGIPLEGYTKIFKRLTEKSNIEIIYNSNYNFENSHDVKYLTIYTGPLDKLLKNKFGKLEWRSLEFKKEIIKNLRQKIKHKSNIDIIIPLPKLEIIKLWSKVSEI